MVTSTEGELDFVYDFSLNSNSITENNWLVCNFVTSYIQGKLVADHVVNLFQPY